MAKTKSKYEYDLAIIILTYNVKDLAVDCLKSIFANKTTKDKWQVIVVDNASTDGSSQIIKKMFPKVKVIESKTNIGFSSGNNLALPYIKAEMVLFLNPDTVVKGKVIAMSVTYMKSHPEAGALICKVILPDGRLDYSCHRGLPTPWNTFTYFSGLARIFPKQKLFAGYTASYLDLDTVHEIDCGSGTYWMVRKTAGDEVNWWDEDYFFNGEDIEFSFRLRRAGWKIIYYPEGEITHFKGSSSGLWKTGKTQVSKETKLRTAKSAIKAMRLFVEKHYDELGSRPVMWLVWLGIFLLEKYRLAVVKLGKKYA